MQVVVSRIGKTEISLAYERASKTWDLDFWNGSRIVLSIENLEPETLEKLYCALHKWSKDRAKSKPKSKKGR